MKKIISLFILAVALGFTATAQKICVVDVEYILNKIPSYQNAQKELDKVSDGFQQEIEAKRKKVDELFKQFQAEQVLMTEQMKQQKIKEIETAEKDLKDLQRKRFGPEGDLFVKRKEFIKPIQDKLYDEIQKYAQAKVYDLILDKSSGASILYLNPKLDKSDDILTNMGITKK